MAAKSKGEKKKVGSLHFIYPSYVPFMQYSERRDLFAKKCSGHISSRAFRGNESDNREIVLKIVNLRLEIAKMLGFSNFAEMILGDRMADTQTKVEKHFLEELFNHCIQNRQPSGILNNIREFAVECGHDDILERWDWAFYSEKLKKKTI